MNIYNREVERKYILKGIDYDQAFAKLNDLYRATWDAVSNDLYWKAGKVDFVRLRENSREITVKVTDKGTVVDRIEENVEVTEQALPDAQRLLTLLFGAPTLKLQKEFSVFEGKVSPAPGTEFNVILCLYRVTSDPTNRIFFEVEAESLAVVDYVLDQLDGMFTMQAESRSLYQIFLLESL